MDIDAHEKHIRTLLAFKERFEPMLTEMLAQYEAFIEEQQKAEGSGEPADGDVGAPAADEAPQGELTPSEAPEGNADGQDQQATDVPASDAPRDASEVAEPAIAEEAEKAAVEPAEQEAPVATPEPEDPPPAAA